MARKAKNAKVQVGGEELAVASWEIPNSWLVPQALDLAEYYEVLGKPANFTGTWDVDYLASFSDLQAMCKEVSDVCELDG